MIDLHVPTFDLVLKILNLSLYEFKKGDISNGIDDLIDAIDLLEDLIDC